MNSLNELFSSTGYITVSRPLIREIGLDAAVLFGELASKADWYEHEHKLTDDGFFYQLADDLERNTGLSPFRQNKALDILEKYGMVVSSIRGLPAKKYFRVCSEQALQFFENLEPKIFKALSYNHVNNNNRGNNNRAIRESFAPPSTTEVEQYISAKGYTFSAEEFVAYYDSQGWKKANGQKLTNWKAACVTWEKKEKEKQTAPVRQKQTRADIDKQKNQEMIRKMIEMGVQFDPEEEDE